MGDSYGGGNLLLYLLNEKGDVLEKRAQYIDKYYNNTAAVLTPNNEIITAGQTVKYEPTLAYDFVIHQLDLKGNILRQKKIKTPGKMADEAKLVLLKRSELLFVGTNTDSDTLYLKKLSKNFELIWEKNLTYGFSPSVVKLENNHLLVASHQLVKNTITLKIAHLDQDGKDIWSKQIANRFVACLRKLGNDEFVMLVKKKRKEYVLIQMRKDGSQTILKEINDPKIGQLFSFVIDQQNGDIILLGYNDYFPYKLQKVCLVKVKLKK